MGNILQNGLQVGTALMGTLQVLTSPMVGVSKPPTKSQIECSVSVWASDGVEERVRTDLRTRFIVRSRNLAIPAFPEGFAQLGLEHFVGARQREGIGAELHTTRTFVACDQGVAVRH